MMPEVASEKGRFFGGVCPIHEIGRQSRYTKYGLPVWTYELLCIYVENAWSAVAAKIDYLRPISRKIYRVLFMGEKETPGGVCNFL